MGYYDATDSADSDLWHVQLASGEVCTMTLDLLDDAFQDGIINEHTYVWQEGSPDWVTLGEVAGLDAVDSEPAVIMSSTGAGFSDSTWPTTVIAPTYPPTSMDPRVLAHAQTLHAYSTAPVAGDITDIDLDIDEDPFKRRKSSKLRWIVAAAFVGAIGFGVVKRHELVQRYRVYLPPSVAARLTSIPSIAAALRLEPPPPPIVQAPAPAPPPAAAPTPEPTPTAAPAATTAPVATTAPASTADSRFSDDQKKALLDADKVRSDKQKQKQKTRVAAPSSTPRVKSENPFHKGGNKFDPLNASL
jgi:hypothetical protein